MSSEPIAARIKKERERMGISYQELARLSGISKSTLQRYETGATPAIPMNKLPPLAQALHVSTAYLIGPTTQTDSETMLKEIFASLSDENREALLLLAQSYLAAERKSKETP